jgi:hypothetical protein
MQASHATREVSSQRTEGPGWAVWRDEHGVIWTRDSAPQDGASAAARLAAIERLLRIPGARGLLVDDTEPAGADTDAAKAAYTAFVRAHPKLRIAVVTSSPDTFLEAFEVGRLARASRLQTFRSLQVARVWLELPGFRAPGDR